MNEVIDVTNEELIRNSQAYDKKEIRIKARLIPGSYDDFLKDNHFGDGMAKGILQIGERKCIRFLYWEIPPNDEGFSNVFERLRASEGKLVEVVGTFHKESGGPRLLSFPNEGNCDYIRPYWEFV
jgi:hypothetical protein